MSARVCAPSSSTLAIRITQPIGFVSTVTFQENVNAYTTHAPSSSTSSVSTGALKESIKVLEDLLKEEALAAQQNEKSHPATHTSTKLLSDLSVATPHANTNFDLMHEILEKIASGATCCAPLESTPCVSDTQSHGNTESIASFPSTIDH